MCETRRAVAERAENIGIWFKILDMLAQLAVISNVSLPVLDQLAVISNVSLSVLAQLAVISNVSPTCICPASGH